jgi:hypothetical protein
MSTSCQIRYLQITIIYFSQRHTSSAFLVYLIEMIKESVTPSQVKFVMNHYMIFIA